MSRSRLEGEKKMAEETYEAPEITVLGEITDMTQSKPGIFFDFPFSAEGNSHRHHHGS
jgi:hypothetical protein